MSYTKELIDEVKAVYPDWAEIIAHAESGSVWLGRYLGDSLPDGIPIKMVLNATCLAELQLYAKIAMRKIELYKKWTEQDPTK